jgi:hypothetical protein
LLFHLNRVVLRKYRGAKGTTMAVKTFGGLVLEVVVALREVSPRSTVELGVIHGFCVDAAHANAPALVNFLSSVEGLQALSAELSRMSEKITAVGIDGAEWRFVGNP